MEPFSLVILPDTQNYTGGGTGTPEILAAQMRWIVDNAAALRIAFVLQEGDVTNANTATAFGHASAAFDILDEAGIPYALAPGNHDGLWNTANTAPFNAAFPPSRFRGRPTFGGVFESGKMDNSYHRFRAGGVDWLVLALEFGPRDSVLAWAGGILDLYPNDRAIVVTHAYLYSDDRLHGALEAHHWIPTRDYGRENDGDDIWNDLLRGHANVAFVFNGHVLNDGQGRRVDVGDHGNRVHSMLCNYQMLGNGGSGYLRVVQLHPAEDRLSAWSWSPWTGRGLIDAANRFGYDGLGVFADRTAPIARGASLVAPGSVAVSFSEPLAEATAEDPASYALKPAAPVAGAVLAADGRHVLLSVEGMQPCQRYRLALDGLADRAPSPNAVASGTSVELVTSERLLFDGFESEALDGWSPVDEGGIDFPSDWRVVSGRLEQRSNIFGPTAESTDHRAGTYARWDDPSARSWTDYELRVVLGSADNDGLGVLFRHADDANYYKLDLDAQRSFRKLFKVVDGTETLLATAAGGYDVGAGNEVVVRLEGPAITVALNGAELFGGTLHDADLSAGTVALYAWGSEGAFFDDVRVRLLSGPCPACPATPARSCYDGPPETEGVGACRSGSAACSDGIWGLCENQVLPADEVCGDGVDDDCDGLDKPCGVPTPAGCGCAGGEAAPVLALAAILVPLVRVRARGRTRPARPRP